MADIHPHTFRHSEGESEADTPDERRFGRRIALVVWLALLLGLLAGWWVYDRATGRALPPPPAAASAPGPVAPNPAIAEDKAQDR